VADAGLREVARDIIAQRAAEETALLDGFADLSDDQITRIMRNGAKQHNGPLGFGLPEAVALITPVVWLVLTDLAQKAAGVAADRAVSRVRALLRRLLRRPQPRRRIPALTAEQLRLVHAQALARARAASLEEAAAQALADAIVSRLARIGDRAGR
jgi:hypothetical protein